MLHLLHVLSFWIPLYQRTIISNYKKKCIWHAYWKLPFNCLSDTTDNYWITSLGIKIISILSSLICCHFFSNYNRLFIYICLWREQLFKLGIYYNSKYNISLLTLVSYIAVFRFALLVILLTIITNLTFSYFGYLNINRKDMYICIYEFYYSKWSLNEI